MKASKTDSRKVTPPLGLDSRHRLDSPVSTKSQRPFSLDVKRAISHKEWCDIVIGALRESGYIYAYFDKDVPIKSITVDNKIVEMMITKGSILKVKEVKL